MRTTFEKGDIVEVVNNTSCGFKEGTICLVVRRIDSIGYLTLIDEGNLYGCTMNQSFKDVRSIY